MAITISDIARDWGCSRQYAQRKVKQGCPLSSLEDARMWRQAHTVTKQTTAPIQLERKLEDEQAYYRSPQGRMELKKFLEGKYLDEALQCSIMAQTEAWRLLREAMLEGKTAKISILLSVHNKAVEARMKTEAAHREEKERRRGLIPMFEAQDLARKGYEIIISRLSALPQNTAPRCNPGDPHRAMDILQTEIATILSDAQKAFVVP